MVTLVASSPTTKSPLIDLSYDGAIKLLQTSLRGARLFWLRLRLGLKLRIRLEGAGGGSVPVATLDSMAWA